MLASGCLGRFKGFGVTGVLLALLLLGPLILSGLDGLGILDWTFEEVVVMGDVALGFLRLAELAVSLRGLKPLHEGRLKDRSGEWVDVSHRHFPLSAINAR
jgi:hypothetical protein